MSTLIDTKESRAFEITKDDGTKAWVRVRRATRRELELADLELSRVFNQGLLAELPPRNRMLRKLRANGVWTDSDSELLDNLRRTVARASLQISEASKKLADLKPEQASQLAAAIAERDKAIAEYEKAFAELRPLRDDIEQMLGHTADAKAENAQRNFLICCVTEYVTVKQDAAAKCAQIEAVLDRVFEGVEAMLACTDLDLLQRIIYEYITFNAGMPSEYQAGGADQPPSESRGGAEPTTSSGDKERVGMGGATGGATEGGDTGGGTGEQTAATSETVVASSQAAP